MKYYRTLFEGKTILCNCDDPYESNFFKYFALNFNALKLKKLIATCYAGSPIVSEQLSLFDVEGLVLSKKTDRVPYKVEITEILDYNNDGAVDLSDIEFLVKNKKNILTKLKGDGDFRSEECIKLLKEADIVITNPPFSLFREYISKLIEYDKKFLVIGNMNAITYKDFFLYVKEEKVWMGASIHSGDREFRVPNNYPLTASAFRVDEQGRKYIRVKGVRWWGNLEYKERKQNLILYKKFNQDEYPRYDNYLAWNVDKVSEIPCDKYIDTVIDETEITLFKDTYPNLEIIEKNIIRIHNPIYGVPITFMDKFNPDQFEIIGLLNSSDEALSGIKAIRTYDEFKEVKQDGTFTKASGKKTKGNPVLKGKPSKGNYYVNINTNECVHSTYARILIKRKENI